MSQRLAAIAQRLGLGAADAQKVLQRSRALALPFSAPERPASGIGWQSGPPLHRLIDLPRGALSGPVQEDKARAHAVLKRLVAKHREERPAIDLREVDGLCSRGPLLDSRLSSFEELAASEACRKVRIISYKDFSKALGLALPDFERKATLRLRQADWHAERLFWDEESHPCEFACAVAYARRRGLEIRLPATIEHYHLQGSALDELQQRYHLLAIPTRAWSDPGFMGLLLDTGLPYARFGLFNSETPESLLLPKDHPQANAFGEGLREIGAPDLVAYLRACLSERD
ncbi:hypothetical protein SAMN05216272_101499 [Pseudomonas panipatensis]|uniref:Uncharacterized protein n=2 Tax=Pseudomonas panipatensis TaxID=428992 RepID=A0A1G8CBR8_9PSED|nr:hypothetical protein SAMN05216272_101499 [Pseudomonas panipatensis]SMP65696.1 hypothetical protein SAMN06295951_10717 [Pseudomonas panipatensis]